MSWWFRNCKYNLLKGNGVSYQLTFDGPTTHYSVERLITNQQKYKQYYKDYKELNEHWCIFEFNYNERIKIS